MPARFLLASKLPQMLLEDLEGGEIFEMGQGVWSEERHRSSLV